MGVVVRGAGGGVLANGTFKDGGLTVNGVYLPLWEL